MIGRAADIWLEPHRLLAKVDFAPTTFAQEVAGLYQAGNMITAPNRAIDVLAVPDTGSAATRIFLKDEDPKGKRDEVLSGRWRGTAPTSAHKIVIEYT